MIATAECFTEEQADAIERRRGELLLDASAGAGKTSVLVERFARAVIEDGVDPSAILAITFTEKAAAELRDRIRSRLRELGAEEAARATEGAFISTIHGFCARVLRIGALAAGIDPAFSVLDELDASRLAQEAFDGALEELATVEGGVALIASHGAGSLRAAIRSVHAELRSRGESSPRLPQIAEPLALEAPRAALQEARARAAAELAALPQPSSKVLEALRRLERCASLLAVAEPWPGDLEQACLPKGNGAALSTATCGAYSEALEAFREACRRRLAASTLALLDRLLDGFGRRYAELKHLHSRVDFTDLELMTRDLFERNAELRERYRSRFEHIMVDELQDTNRVQLELIRSIARSNLFTVGDALQSIYGFRHADVELFEERRSALAHIGALATLTTNFRSRPEILDVLNAAFEQEVAFGERFTSLRAGRDRTQDESPAVELLLADKGADWGGEDTLAVAWRAAEARMLGARIRELVDGGASPGEIVVLLRATTDMRTYERALEHRAIPTYVIGGRGYWTHPQVLDFVCYLRALANPRDEQALYTVLASPLVGVGTDAMVLLAAAAREAARDPWWVLRSGEYESPERDRLEAFAAWFADERAASARYSVEELIERAMEITSYDLTMLALPGGERRLANVRKLMRLAREYESSGRNDVRGFLELVDDRKFAASREARESEAPVEGEALDAVRLMTIHRAKGLEFPIVCVADLGRGPRWGGELLRLGRDGRIGLRLGRPGTGKRENALDYDVLGEEAKRAEATEERRLFYVAITRAQERLILSGAAKLDPFDGGGAPIAWIAPSFVPELATELEGGADGGISARGVAWRVSRTDDGEVNCRDLHVELPAPAATLVQREPATPGPPVSHLSYSALGDYERCGYRFYLERVLGLPRRGEASGGPGAAEGGARGTRLSAAERGVLAHALLERLDFLDPARPAATDVVEVAALDGLAPSPTEIAELRDLVERFGASELCKRLAAAEDVRREERFGFVLSPVGLTINGVLDVIASEPGRALVVDYKSDRLEGESPEVVVERLYGRQRLVYALAALIAGAAEVEVAHVFLERPDRPVSARFAQAARPELGRELVNLAGGVLDRDFGVSPVPCRTVCASCPGEGGLCSWPLEMTRREAVDTLF